MEIKLKGREMPRGPAGDVKFTTLGVDSGSIPVGPHEPCVLEVFSPPEVVELVNRALYQLEYQRESHRKRGQSERDKMKALKAALKAQGKDVKTETINKQLKGE